MRQERLHDVASARPGGQVEGGGALLVGAVARGFVGQEQLHNVSKIKEETGDFVKCPDKYL